MTIELVSVLREFELLERSTPNHENRVFDSYAYVSGEGFTKFSRFMETQECAWDNSLVVMDEDTTIGSGEDPRTFVWRGSACAIATTYSEARGFIQNVYIKTLDKWIILVPPASIKSGKNWTPFVRADELYFVHEFSPFRVLKARTLSENDDFLVLDVVAEHDIPTSKSHDKFSMYRGGSNGVEIAGSVLGIGHTNVRAHNTNESMVHRPFVFVYRPEESVTYFAFDYEFPDTYRIVDPTCLYQKDGVLYLVTCETERVWDITPQKGRICLYSLQLSGELNENGFGIGSRRLHWWRHDNASKIRRLLGTWRRS